MPTYEYRSDAGNVIEEYFAVGAAPESVERTEAGKVVRYGRVFSTSVGAVVRSGSGGVTYKGQRVPVSRTLPLVPKGTGTPVIRGGVRVRDLGDGTYCDMQGRRIVDSDTAAKKHAAACRYTKE